MKHPKTLLTALLIIPTLFFAQAEQQFNGVNMKESMATVQTKLKDIVASSKVITVKNTVFPLAKDKEQHLICSELKTKTGTISKAVFSFADDQLTAARCWNGYSRCHGSHCSTNRTHEDQS